VGFTSSAEQEALLNLVDGVIPNLDGNQLDIGATPLLKLFSQSPFDSTEEGLSFVQAELIKYNDADGRSQYMYLDQNAGEQFWSLNLANASNYLFFDGSGLIVRGGNLADELVGGAGNDFFYSRSSGAGIDKLSGGNGSDIFVAGSYEYQTDDRSIVLGGGGSDRIVMVSGQIQATGNDGADRYYLAPSFYDGNVGLKVTIQDFEVGSDQLYIPTSFYENLMSYTTISEDGAGMSIDLHGLSLNVEGMNLAYGSVMEVMFQEAIDIPDSSEVIAQLILGDDASFEGWSDLQSVMNLWV
jgi:Ca2+-binding RTX toxin-like protein